MNIAFDIGNVLMEVNIEPICSALYDTQLVGSITEAWEKMNYLFPLMELGHHSFESLLKAYPCSLGTRKLSLLKEALGAALQPHQEILTWLKEISSEHNVALLSNIGYDNMRAFNVPEFDSLIKFYSCEWGLRKPSRAYFETFLSLHPEFKGSIFIDDRTENISAAKLSGLDARQFAIDAEPSTALVRLQGLLVELK